MVSKHDGKPKILLHSGYSPDDSMYDWIVPDLVAFGYHIQRFHPERDVHYLGLEAYHRLLIARIVATQPDFLFLHPPYDYLTTAVAEQIKSLGTRLIGFAYDDEIFLPFYTDPYQNAGQLLRQLAGRFDLYGSTSSRTIQLMQESGCTNAHYVRWASSTGGYPEVASLKKYPVTLIGTAYPRRLALVRYLVAQGVPIRVWGNGWEHYPDVQPIAGGRVSTEQMRWIYAQSAIVLAPADWEHNQCLMVKLRTLEIALCGAFQLMENCLDLADYYTPEEIEVYGDWEELVSMIDFYIHNPDEREAIAQAGYERTRKEHTWRTRWPELLALLPAPASPRPLDLHSLTQATLHAADYAEAVAQESCGQPYMAFCAYQKVLSFYPQDYLAHLGSGRCALAAGRWAEAEQQLRLALEAAPRVLDPELHSSITISSYFTKMPGFKGLEALPPAFAPLKYLMALQLHQGDIVGLQELWAEVMNPNLRYYALSWVASDFNPEQSKGDIWRWTFTTLLAAEGISLAATKTIRTQQTATWQANLGLLS